MSRSRKDGHGRCGACGDCGENRRKREAAWHAADARDDQMSFIWWSCNSCGTIAATYNDVPPAKCGCDGINCMQFTRVG